MKCNVNWPLFLSKTIFDRRWLQVEHSFGWFILFINSINDPTFIIIPSSLSMKICLDELRHWFLNDVVLIQIWADWSVIRGTVCIYSTGVKLVPCIIFNSKFFPRIQYHCESTRTMCLSDVYVMIRDLSLSSFEDNSSFLRGFSDFFLLLHRRIVTHCLARPMLHRRHHSNALVLFQIFSNFRARALDPGVVFFLNRGTCLWPRGTFFF